jgi:hypothetical protein
MPIGWGDCSTHAGTFLSNLASLDSIARDRLSGLLRRRSRAKRASGSRDPVAGGDGSRRPMAGIEARYRIEGSRG